jgi:hypothetical protein
MAYIHQVSFTIQPDQMSELRIGASLERTLGYLRTLLPNEPGHIESRAMFSVDISDQVHVVFQSIWQDWENTVRHRDSRLSEDKVLVEFAPHINSQDLVSHTYGEVP